MDNKKRILTTVLLLLSNVFALKEYNKSGDLIFKVSEDGKVYVIKTPPSQSQPDSLLVKLADSSIGTYPMSFDRSMISDFWEGPFWDQIPDKPDSFQAIAHSHSLSDVTGLNGALAGKEPTITGSTSDKFWNGLKQWVNITIGNVLGLNDTITNHRTAIASKLNISDTSSLARKNHGHLISEITNLQTTLDDKQATISAGTTGQFYAWDKTMKAVDWTYVANKPSSIAYKNEFNVFTAPSGISIDDVTAESDATSTTNWNVVSHMQLESNNNKMAFFLGHPQNERKAFIQVGHASSSFASHLGELRLNPFGGNVTVNGYGVWHSGNFDPSTKANATHGHAWGDISSKPSTFAPAEHGLVSSTHTVSGLTAGHVLKALSANTYGFGAIAWSDITDKPSAYAPAAHTLVSHSDWATYFDGQTLKTTSYPTFASIYIPNGGLINDWTILGATNDGSERFWYKAYELTNTGRADEDIELRIEGDVNYYYGACIVRLKITRFEGAPANQLHVTITPISGWPSNALVKVDGGIVWVASNLKWGDIYGRLVQSRYKPNRVLFNTTYTQTEPAGVSINGTFGVKTYNGDAQNVVLHNVDGADGNFTGNISLLNKAGNAWLNFATRDVSGSEAKFRLSNIADLAMEATSPFLTITPYSNGGIVFNTPSGPAGQNAHWITRSANDGVLRISSEVNGEDSLMMAFASSANEILFNSDIYFSHKNLFDVCLSGTVKYNRISVIYFAGGSIDTDNCPGIFLDPIPSSSNDYTLTGGVIEQRIFVRNRSTHVQYVDGCRIEPGQFRDFLKTGTGWTASGASISGKTINVGHGTGNISVSNVSTVHINFTPTSTYTMTDGYVGQRVTVVVLGSAQHWIEGATKAHKIVAGEFRDFIYTTAGWAASAADY